MGHPHLPAVHRLAVALIAVVSDAAVAFLLPPLPPLPLSLLREDPS
jgi:hypothetical protein